MQSTREDIPLLFLLPFSLSLFSHYLSFASPYDPSERQWLFIQQQPGESSQSAKKQNKGTFCCCIVVKNDKRGLIDSLVHFFETSCR